MRSKENIMPASIAFARAGGTTGEWTSAIASEAGGRFTLPIAVPVGTDSPHPFPLPSQLGWTSGPVDHQRSVLPTSTGRRLHLARGEGRERGKRTRILLAKVGLDGHINAIKVLAHACREAGMEVIFLGARQTPENVVAAAIAEDVALIGISSLAGSHCHIAEEVLALLRAHAVDDCKLVIGGIIPPDDIITLKTMGVADIFTPQDADTQTVVERLLILGRG